MATETLIEEMFSTAPAGSRIAALHTAIVIAEENGVEPFPAASDAQASDRQAVKESSNSIVAAFNGRGELQAEDAAVVYLGRALGSDPTLAEQETLLVARMALAIDDYSRAQF
jgi:hypothetical protein